MSRDTVSLGYRAAMGLPRDNAVARVVGVRRVMRALLGVLLGRLGSLRDWAAAWFLSKTRRLAALPGVAMPNNVQKMQ